MVQSCWSSVYALRANPPPQSSRHSIFAACSEMSKGHAGVVFATVKTPVKPLYYGPLNRMPRNAPLVSSCKRLALHARHVHCRPKAPAPDLLDTLQDTAALLLLLQLPQSTMTHTLTPGVACSRPTGVGAAAACFYPAYAPHAPHIYRHGSCPPQLALHTLSQLQAHMHARGWLLPLGPPLPQQTRPSLISTQRNHLARHSPAAGLPRSPPMRRTPLAPPWVAPEVPAA